MPIRVGINGFGRIGRLVLRAAQDKDIEIVGINDLTDDRTMAHLLKYDSVLGQLPNKIEAVEGGISVDGDVLKVLSERDPDQLPWGDLGVDVVVESTGVFNSKVASAPPAGAETTTKGAPPSR